MSDYPRSFYPKDIYTKPVRTVDYCCRSTSPVDRWVLKTPHASASLSFTAHQAASTDSDALIPEQKSGLRVSGLPPVLS